MASNEEQHLGSVLIIGGCGFVGHHIVQQLLSSYSCNISVLDLRTTHNREAGVTYFDGDITSRDAVLSVFQKAKPNVIFHTASPAGATPGQSNRVKRASNALYHKVNVEGTKNLLNCAADIKTVKAFVYTSSASVIHDTVSDLANADERFPVLYAPIQREYYSETKAIAESLVLKYNRQRPATAKAPKAEPTSMLTCAIRPALIFGEGDVTLIPNLIAAYDRGQTKFQLGQNENLWDFTYVGNVVHAHILAALALLQTSQLNIEPLDHEKVDGEAFFITNGSPLYFWDFTRMVWSLLGDKTEPGQVWIIDKELGLVIATVMEWVYWVATFGGVPNLTRHTVNYSSMTRYYSIDKAAKRLGYMPIWNMSDAVSRTMTWFKQSRSTEEKKTQ